MRNYEGRRTRTDGSRTPAGFVRASTLSLGLASVLLTAAGCASTSAKARTDPAPLTIPEPPPRLIEPLPEVAAMPVPEPERRDPVPPAPRLPPRQRDTGQATRSDPKPVDPAAKPLDPVPVTEAPLPPAPERRAELRTPETANEQTAAREVQETIDRASRTLGRIDYKTLAKDGQEQYNTAKNFIDQAKQALEARNYIHAKFSADKADTIAKGLTGR
jgi:hypothetical protein